MAAGVVIGFLAGSTALASAGTLPDPAQDAAHEVLGAVGVNVPRSTEGCPAGSTFRNHGEYVASVEAAGGDVEAAAHSACGKPAHGSKGKGGASDKATGTPRADTDGDPCTGPPPWAGAHLSASEKDALRSQRAATCGPDTDAEDKDAAEKKDDAETPETPETAKPEADATTTTTEPAAPTTTTAAPTTTTVPTTTTTG